MQSVCCKGYSNLFNILTQKIHYSMRLKQNYAKSITTFSKTNTLVVMTKLAFTGSKSTPETPK